MADSHSVVIHRKAVGVSQFCVTTIKYLRYLTCKRKGFFRSVLAVPLKIGQTHSFGPLVGMPDGNGEEHMVEQTVYLMARKKKTDRRRG